MPSSSSSPDSCRQLRKDARSGEILSAALGVFHAKGFAAATIADVARAAGVANGTVYLYFPSKQDLFKAVVCDLVAPNIERIEEAALAQPTPTAQLRTALELWAAAMQNGRGCLAKLLIAEAGNFPDMVAFFRREVSERVRQMLRQIIEAGVACGEFRPCDVVAVVRMLTASLVMASVWQYTLPEDTDFPTGPSSLVSPMLDVVFNGIATHRDCTP